MKKRATKNPSLKNKGLRTLSEHELEGATGGGDTTPPPPVDPNVFGRTL